MRQKILGRAFDADSGDLLYSEHHFCAEDMLECVVNYRDSYGELIARKTLDFSTGSYQPSLQMSDFRRSSEYSFNTSKQENLVVDAGFDNFIRGNWQDLDEGEVVKFPFKVMGIDSPLKMQALRDVSGDCNDKQLCLKVTLDSWFLGMLVAPIKLSYSKEGRRLLRFRGVSNIVGAAGESLNVDLRYDYEDGILPLGSLYQREPEAFSL
ncbi:MAG: hypothetical protein V7746_17615 [Halioglobus sp.]